MTRNIYNMKEARRILLETLCLNLQEKSYNFQNL
jgi:hypothetical protein